MSAEQLTAEGRRLFPDNKFEAAIERFVAAQTIAPSYAPAHFCEGLAASRSASTEQASENTSIGSRPIRRTTATTRHSGGARRSKGSAYCSFKTKALAT
jgi:hypothetical protein